MDHQTADLVALDHSLRETRAQLEAALDDLSPDQAEIQCATGWTIRQTVAHLVSAEASMVALCQRIVAGEGGTRDDFDLNRFNASQVEKRSQMPLADLLAHLESNRQNTIAYLATLSPADLQQTGRHGSGQILSVAKILAVIGQHEANHAREISQARG